MTLNFMCFSLTSLLTQVSVAYFLSLLGWILGFSNLGHPKQTSRIHSPHKTPHSFLMFLYLSKWHHRLLNFGSHPDLLSLPPTFPQSISRTVSSTLKIHPEPEHVFQRSLLPEWSLQRPPHWSPNVMSCCKSPCNNQSNLHQLLIRPSQSILSDMIPESAAGGLVHGWLSNLVCADSILFHLLQSHGSPFCSLNTSH